MKPGGPPAPLGVRGAAGRENRPAPDAAEHRDVVSRVGSPPVLLATLFGSLLAYAAIAADVVHHGRLTGVDERLSDWVARSMPAWVEWLARPFSWAGGVVGVTLVVALALVWLLRRGDRVRAGLILVVALGAQLVTTLSKNGYDRPRPTAGSPIDIPSSFSFPSGHALTGIAVFGLLGIVVADGLASRRARRAAAAAGFVLGALIGASRVVLNVHFLSDVLGGAALGLAWLAICLIGAGVVARRAPAGRLSRS